ncbi:hypothetical protein ACIG56_00070 [Nocardia fusca]
MDTRGSRDDAGESRRSADRSFTAAPERALALRTALRTALLTT